MMKTLECEGRGSVLCPYSLQLEQNAERIKKQRKNEPIQGGKDELKYSSNSHHQTAYRTWYSIAIAKDYMTTAAFVLKY